MAVVLPPLGTGSTGRDASDAMDKGGAGRGWGSPWQPSSGLENFEKPSSPPHRLLHTNLWLLNSEPCNLFQNK